MLHNSDKVNCCWSLAEVHLDHWFYVNIAKNCSTSIVHPVATSHNNLLAHDNKKTDHFHILLVITGIKKYLKYNKLNILAWMNGSIMVIVNVKWFCWTIFCCRNRRWKSVLALR